MNPSSEKSDYLKLVDFMKRVSMTDQEQIQEHITSPKSKNPLIPRVPDSYENCTLTF